MSGLLRMRATSVSAMCAVVMLGGAGCTTSAVVEPDGDGPLSLGLKESGFVSIKSPKSLPADGEWSGTFGSLLPCLTTTDSGPARLTGLTFADADDPEPVSIALYLRSFDSATETPIGSMRGGAEDLASKSIELREGVEGLDVETACHDLNGFDGEVADEILISLTADERGAHVGGVTASYSTADDVKHKVRSDWDFYLCGSEVPDKFCDV